MINLILFIIVYIAITIYILRFFRIGNRYESKEKELSDENLKENNYNRVINRYKKNN